MNSPIRLSVLFVVALGGIAAAAACADTVQLVNGDRINGEVIALDKDKLTLESDIHGELVIERGKVVAIALGDHPLPSASPSDARKDASRNGKTARDKDAALAETPDDVLERLRADGIPVEQVDQLTKKFPLLGTPQVKQQFDHYLGGLMSGKLDIQDIRKDAIKARDELNDLKKDLGPYGDALNGYLGILEGFIEETDPQAANEKSQPRKKFER